MLARVEAGDVIEMRNITLDDVPGHKRSLWVNVVDDRPVINNLTHNLSGPVIIVEQNQVVRRWSAIPRPHSEVQSTIREEARRRILERYPDWKQTNMVARGVELQDIWRRVGTWTPEEQAEADALKSAWDWISEVRASSNQIEVMDPMPEDINNDSLWPE